MKWALLALAVLAALLPLRMGESAATFVASSANPAASFATASDFNTVAVALSDPGAVLRGSVTLTATAASNRGIASVRFQRAGAGTSTWTDVCVDTVAPYTCAWNDADGLYDLRAVALDSAGYSRTATVTGRRIDNTAPATTLTDPGSPLTGAKTLSATASDAGSGVASVALQYRSGGEWTTICAQSSCSWSTSALPDGLYDLRSLATDTAGNTSTSVVSNRRVDNRAPSIAVNSPAPRRAARSPSPARWTTAPDRASPRCATSSAPAPAPGATSATRRARPSPARPTPPASPTASTTCARSRPTAWASRPPRRR